MANAHGNTFTKLKTITAHVGFSRFLGACEQDGDGCARFIGQIPRPTDIPSPYSYAPTWEVYSYQGVPVIVAETSHKRYEVFRVAGPLLPCEEEA